LQDEVQLVASGKPPRGMDIRRLRDDLQAQLHKIYRSAPNTDGRAYGQEQNALKRNEDLTFSDAEIDAFLPGPLKRTSSA
jgi:conflict system pore-forming effector with SLATT domain